MKFFTSQKLRRFILTVIFPILIYFLIFCIYTYPAIFYFSTKIYADTIDGLVHFWNLWWIQKSVLDLHSSIWWTNYLFYPEGVSLYAHSLNPYNGFVLLPFSPFLTLIQSYNLIVVVTFILSGFTTYLLCLHLTKNPSASIISGFIFAFSGYRFAHTQGHMELISTQWIPLFVFFILKYTTKPSIRYAIGLAVTLFLNLICTPYYFIFSLMSGTCVFLCKLNKNHSILFSRKTIIPNIVLIILFILPASFYLMPVITIIQNEVSLQYSPKDYSTDLLSPVIFGGHSRFAEITRWYWEKLPGNIHESSVYFGIIPLLLAIYVCKLKVYKNQSLYIWYFIALLFFVLSLGPVLHIRGREFGSILMPYTFFEFIWQSLSIGTPIRFIIIVILCISLISAYAFAYLFQNKHLHRSIAIFFIIVLFIEYWPKPITLSDVTIPNYVRFLKNLSVHEGLIDLVAQIPSLRMYYQTYHEKPVQFGYISRIPLRTITTSILLSGYIQNYDYIVLNQKYNFRYWVNSKPLPQKNPCPKLLYHDSDAFIYDLSSLSTSCDTLVNK